MRRLLIFSVLRPALALAQVSTPGTVQHTTASLKLLTPTAATASTITRSDVLQVYWTFNSGSGAYQANSGLLGATGNGTQAAVSAQCTVGSGYGSFDGGDSLRTTGAGLLNGSTQWTATVWINPRVSPAMGAQHNFFYGKGTSSPGTTYAYYRFGWDSKHIYQAYQQSGYGGGSSTDMPTGSWHHIVVQADHNLASGTFKVWVDGTNVHTTTGTYGGSLNVTSTWDVGNSAINAWIDEFRMYNAYLSGAEITNIIAEGRP